MLRLPWSLATTLRVAFAAGLLLTQWLAVVHATQHELSAQPDRPICQLCAFAHAGGPAASAPALPLPVSFHRASATPVVAAPHLDRRYTLPPSRAPPR
ncbi:MAG: hypothetical protein KGJ55_00205 [Gammaproteobacteria bacterium]|nr:hypothetical protein [Gammaproteobacteria bacterium]